MTVKTFEINPHDHYDRCLTDSVNKPNKKDNIKPKGYVEIFEQELDGKTKLLGKHNLVLYNGREWLAQRMVNKNNANVTSTYSDYISWFGLGDGGVTSGDPFSPLSPVITDTDLASRVMINTSDSSSADYHVVSSGYPEEGYYKLPFDDISFEQDELNDDFWLKIKINITVGTSDANGKQLSEAGLFTGSSNEPTATNFNIFSRVTFPSIVKTSDRRLIFNWYLYV